jgi:hypothetical protein
MQEGLGELVFVLLDKVTDGIGLVVEDGTLAMGSTQGDIAGNHTVKDGSDAVEIGGGVLLIVDSVLLGRDCERTFLIKS